MIHKKFAKTLSAVLAFSLMLSGCGSSADSGSDTAATKGNEASAASEAAPADNSDSTAAPADTVSEDNEVNELSSIEVVRMMGNGINLGNTLEAYNHKGYLGGTDPDGMETGWGQPYTTEEMIKGMKAAGFDTIRIPIAWTNGMKFEDGDYTIDERLMSRVETVVKYAIDADMYVIINDHWDGSWWGMFGSEDQSVRDKALEMYKSMWTQIGERFKGYSYKLIFESANEELGDRLNDSDVTGSKGVLTENECYETTNMINSEFVKLIRSQGGKNADRFLLIAGYNTDISKTCNNRFKMPEDTADSKLLLSVHYYTPWDYCGTDGVNQWGSPNDYKEQNDLMEKLSMYSEQGYGVVIGEYAVMMKNGGLKPDIDKFYSNLLNNCDLYDFCPVLWDCNNLFKRSSITMADDTLAAMYSERRYENESSRSVDEVKSDAKAGLDAAMEEAEKVMNEGIEFPPSDDMAIAWIMYASSDYGISYSVGDTYDPTNMTSGIAAANCQITGEGTYTVGLDFSANGSASGVAFSALGISNGELLFPGYIYTIDEILINGEAFEPSGKCYTSSDDDKCTRVNLFNQWVSKVPDDARTIDGSLDGCSASIMDLNGKKVKDISITFTVTAPAE